MEKGGGCEKVGLPSLQIHNAYATLTWCHGADGPERCTSQFVIRFNRGESVIMSELVILCSLCALSRNSFLALVAHTACFTVHLSVIRVT